MRNRPPAPPAGPTVPLLLFLAAAVLLAAPFDPGAFPWSLWPGWAVLFPPGAALAAALLAGLLRRFRRRHPHPWFLPFHLASAFALGWAVKLLFPSWHLVPLAFAALFPLSLLLRPRDDQREVTFRSFWVRPDILWLPLLALLLPALGRLAWPPGDPRPAAPHDLLLWAGGFFLWGLLAALAHGWWLYESRYREQKDLHDRLFDDARALGGEMAKGEPLGTVEGKPGKGPAVKVLLTTEQDQLLYEVLRLGIRFFSARTAILFLNEHNGWRVRAMATEKGMGGRTRPGVLPADSELMRDAIKAGKVLVEGAALRPPEQFPFYEKGVKVGSFLLRVIEGGEAGHPWFGALYLDAAEPDWFGDDSESRLMLEQLVSSLLRVFDVTETMKGQLVSLERTDLLVNYARSLTETLDPEAIALLALQALLQGAPAPSCDGAAVVLAGEGSAWVPAAEGILLAAQRRKDETIDLSEKGRSVVRQVIRSGLPLAKDQPLAGGQPFFAEGERLPTVGSFYPHPSRMAREDRPEVVAVMALARREPGGVPEEARSWAKAVANITAPALANAFTHREVERLSRTDPLTGLDNRRAFMAALEKKMRRMERYHQEEPFGLLLLDLDHFKKVNDTYGHPVGDEVLREAASRVRCSLREFDTVGRYGGEEFIALLDRVKSEKDAAAIAEKIRGAVRGSPFPTQAGPLQVRCSLGFALYRREEGVTLQELVDRADQALYQAKAGGRDRAVGHQPGPRAPQPGK